MASPPEQLVERAQQRTGLPEFHGNGYCEGLDVLTRELAACNRLSVEGRHALDDMIVADLAKRLVVDDYLRAYPDVTAAPVEQPLFVLGMPRTGTTLLINLLDQDRRRRTLLKWEVETPVPPPEAASLRTDPRCLAMIEADRVRVEKGEVWADIHFEWPDQPRECVYVMSQSFKATSYEAFAPMPAYSEFLFSCDMVPTYEHHRRVLQTLQSHAPGRWTLKAPGHAMFLPALLEVYPDARIVWTHRDPFTAVGSLCSLITRSQGTFCDEADHDWIRRHYPEYVGEHARRVMAMRGRLGDQLYDVQYAELVLDPVTVIEDLYRWLGQDVTEELRAGVAAWVIDNPNDKHGRHSYSLERFGLTVDDVAPYFDDYLSEYAVAREGA